VELTREIVEERKAQLQADLNAIAGAMQDCDYWLHEIDEAENGIPIEELIPGAVVEEIVPIEVTE
jgi:hypothetical protein